MKTAVSATAMTRGLARAVLAGALLLGGAPTGLYGTTTAGAAELVVNIDEASIHRLMSEAATIVVGNPAIADVSVQNGSMLLVMGKNPGHTNIIALDRKGAEIENVMVHVRNAGTRRVTLHLGSSRLSYNCAPKCDRILAVSDAEAPFDAQQKQMTGKTTISQGTADQAGSAGQ
jgi:Flp pilus assembly secretin CpaC